MPCCACAALMFDNHLVCTYDVSIAIDCIIHKILAAFRKKCGIISKLLPLFLVQSDTYPPNTQTRNEIPQAMCLQSLVPCVLHAYVFFVWLSLQSWQCLQVCQSCLHILSSLVVVKTIRRHCIRGCTSHAMLHVLTPAYAASALSILDFVRARQPN